MPGDRVAFQGNSHVAGKTGKRDLKEHTPTRVQVHQKNKEKKGNAFRNNYPEGICV